MSVLFTYACSKHAYKNGKSIIVGTVWLSGWLDWLGWRILLFAFEQTDGRTDEQSRAEQTEAGLAIADRSLSFSPFDR